MDTMDALVGMFPGSREKWKFSWHAKAACEAALVEVLEVAWSTQLLAR
jgi:hypothetical protein